MNFTLLGITKILIALRFYAVGAFYQVIGDMFGVSTYVVRSTIIEVSFLIATKLRGRFIVMPETQQEILNAKVDFMRQSEFPMCIAAVDGTHVPIQSYGGAEAEIYRNRKMFFSHNCQLAVSADVNFLRQYFILKLMEKFYFDRGEFSIVFVDGLDQHMTPQYSHIQICTSVSCLVTLETTLLLSRILRTQQCILYASHWIMPILSMNELINTDKSKLGMLLKGLMAN